MDTTDTDETKPHVRRLVRLGASEDLIEEARRHASMQATWEGVRHAPTMVRLVLLLRCNRYMLTRSLLGAALHAARYMDDARISAAIHTVLHMDRHDAADHVRRQQDDTLLESALCCGDYLVECGQWQRQLGAPRQYCPRAAALALAAINLQRTDERQDHQFRVRCLHLLVALEAANYERRQLQASSDGADNSETADCSEAVRRIRHNAVGKAQAIACDHPDERKKDEENHGVSA